MTTIQRRPCRRGTYPALIWGGSFVDSSPIYSQHKAAAITEHLELSSSSSSSSSFYPYSSSSSASSSSLRPPAQRVARLLVVITPAPPPRWWRWWCDAAGHHGGPPAVRVSSYAWPTRSSRRGPGRTRSRRPRCNSATQFPRPSCPDPGEVVIATSAFIGRDSILERAGRGPTRSAKADSDSLGELAGARSKLAISSRPRRSRIIFDAFRGSSARQYGRGPSPAAPTRNEQVLIP